MDSNIFEYLVIVTTVLCKYNIRNMGDTSETI